MKDKRQSAYYTISINTIDNIYDIKNIYEEEYYSYKSLAELFNKIEAIDNRRCYLYIYDLDKYSAIIFNYLTDINYSPVMKITTKLLNNEVATTVKSRRWYSIAYKNNNHIKVIYDAKKLLSSTRIDELAEAFKVNGTAANICSTALYWLSKYVDINNSTISKAVFKKALESLMENDRENPLEPRAYKRYFKDKITLDIDKELREAYKGGLLYCKPGTYKNIHKIDVNSMYPSILRDEYLPVGSPIIKTNIYTLEQLKNIPYKCYIIKFRTEAKLKVGKFAVLSKRENMYDKRSILIDKCDKTTEFFMTNRTFNLFLENYDIKALEINRVYCFSDKKGVFKDIIDYFYNLKVNASKENNAGQRLIYKICLNSLTGRFGLNRENTLQQPYLSDNTIKFNKVELDPIDGVYLPIAIFMNDIAKERLIRAAQSIGIANIIAMDTDCIQYINVRQLPEEIEIDDYKLGAFKYEGIAEEGKYYNTRAYMQIVSGQPKVYYTGLDKECKEFIKTFNDFDIGKQYTAKRLTIIDNKEVYKEHTITIGAK